MTRNLKSDSTGCPFTRKDYDRIAENARRRANDSSLPCVHHWILTGECSRFKVQLFPGVAGVCVIVSDAETPDPYDGLPSVVYQSPVILDYGHLVAVCRTDLAAF